MHVSVQLNEEERAARPALTHLDKLLTTVSRRFAPDFTTESTEFTETDWKEGRKGSEPDPEPFPSGLGGLCALCGETPDRAGRRQIPRELWLAPMTHLDCLVRA
jgi:hypothetical protein